MKFATILVLMVVVAGTTAFGQDIQQKVSRDVRQGASMAQQQLVAAQSHVEGIFAALKHAAQAEKLGRQFDTAESPQQCFLDLTNLVQEGCIDQDALSGGGDTNAMMNKMCSSGCYDKLITIIRKCTMLFPSTPGTPPLWKILGLTCTKIDGEYCGVSMNIANTCGNHTGNASACAAAPSCVYHAKTTMCQPPASMICHPCLQRMLRMGLSLVPGANGADSMVGKLSDFMCYKAPNGAFCIDVFDQDEGDFGNATASTNGKFGEQQLDRICSNLTERVCFSKLTGGTARLQEYVATQTLKTCLKNAWFKSDEQDCLNIWRFQMYQAWTISRSTDIMCLANHAGKHCSRVMAKPASNFSQCLVQLTTGDKTCSSKCNEVANDTVGELGCCLGFYSEISRTVVPPEFAFMRPQGMHLPRGLLPTPTHAKKGTHVNPIAAFEKCPSTSNINATLDKTCPALRSAMRSNRRLGLRIRWHYLLNNRTLLELINATLREDLMANIGISSDDLTHFNLTIDTSVVIKADAGSAASGSSSGASRFFRLQEDDATASGTQVSVGFATNSDEYTTGLSDSFDHSLNDDTVSLTATNAALKDNCADCISGDEGQLIASSSSSSNGDEDEGSTNVGLIVGIIVGVLVVIVVVGVVVFKATSSARRKSEEGEYDRV